MKRVTGALAMVLNVMLICGCDSGVSDGPPEVVFGRDVCDHCGMIISDGRSAASSVVVREGVTLVVRFDDPGDLFTYHRDHPGDTVLRQYVTDYAGKSWIDLSAAFFVHSPEVHTPMGSGLMAFRSEADAQAAVQKFGGKRLTLEEMQALRSGKPISSTQCCEEKHGQ